MTHRARWLGMVVVGLPVTFEATYTLLRSFHFNYVSTLGEWTSLSTDEEVGTHEKGGKSRPKRLGFPYQGIPAAVRWVTLGGKEPQMELWLQQKYCCLWTLHMHEDPTHTRKSG